jgi:undecaprenyl-diphosphatase
VDVELDIQHFLLPHKVVTQVLDGVSAINWPIPSAVALVVSAGVLLMLRHRLAAIIILATTSLADGASFVTNEIVRRPRPTDHGLYILQHIGNYYSFPSGHVIHALTCYGVLLFVTLQVRRPAAWLWAIRVILAALIVLMPISRIVEGEHWPSDVLEGLFYGVFWLILGIIAYGWAWRHWTRLRGRHDDLLDRQPAPSSWERHAWSGPGRASPPSTSATACSSGIDGDSPSARGRALTASPERSIARKVHL